MSSAQNSAKQRKRPLTKPSRARSALAPQRSGGRQRVASLVTAAAEVIRERGFDAATMAEIAARADTKIGSLYRFFPNKEVLVDTLVQRYANLIDSECDAIDSRLSAMTTDELADVFVNFLVSIRDETKALSALLEARSQWSVKRLEFRAQVLKRIASTLLLKSSGMQKKVAKDVAVILFNNMRTMVAMKLDKSVPTSPGSPLELRLMNRLYLKHKLGG